MKDVWTRSRRTGPVRGWSRRPVAPRDAAPARLPVRMAPAAGHEPDHGGAGRRGRPPPA